MDDAEDRSMIFLMIPGEDRQWRPSRPHPDRMPIGSAAAEPAAWTDGAQVAALEQLSEIYAADQRHAAGGGDASEDLDEKNVKHQRHHRNAGQSIDPFSHGFHLLSKSFRRILQDIPQGLFIRRIFVYNEGVA